MPHQTSPGIKLTPAPPLQRIRAWRESIAPMSNQLTVFSPRISCALRQERARKGQRDYDLNRHIRLLKLKDAMAPRRSLL